MMYEVGIYYPDNAHDTQVQIQNIPVPVQSRRFWLAGIPIPHWNEDETNTWVKVPVLNGMTKIYVDDSAKKDLSNIDDVMIFGDDFRNETSLDTTKWVYTIYCLEQLGSYSSSGDVINLSFDNGALFSGTGTINTTTVNGVTVGWLGHSIRSLRMFNNVVIETKFYHNSVYSNLNTDDDGFAFGIEISNNDGTIRDNIGTWHTDSYIDTALRIRIDSSTSGIIIYSSDLSIQQYHKYILYKSTNIIKGTVDDLPYASTTPNVTNEGSIVIFNTVRNVGDKLYEKYDYIFVREYLPTDPVIKYIRPVTHLNWYFGKR